jgi:RHS repeat-associated protein
VALNFWVSASPAPGSGWTYQSGTYTVPASGVAYVFLFVDVYQNTVTTSFRVDDGFICAGTNYYHQDHLSNRLVTSSTGAVVEQMGHFPFGDPWYNATNDKLYFTTYERDAESSNDYAKARFYRWLLGRFLSPDPLSGSIGDPQSLDRYTYVEDDPINLSDHSGQCPRWGPFLKIASFGHCTAAATDDIDPYAYDNFELDFLSFIFANTGNCEDCGPAFGNLNLFLEFDPGLNNAGCTPGPLMTGCLVNQAVDKAKQLLNNPDCSKFIGGNGPVDPSTLLGLLAAGSPGYGNISVGPLNSAQIVGQDSNAFVVATTAGAKPSVYTTNSAALITINSSPSSPFNSSEGGGFDPGPGPFDRTTLNAETILHELGHAINFIFGSGTSGVFNDGSSVPGGLLLSFVNKVNVFENCIPK